MPGIAVINALFKYTDQVRLTDNPIVVPALNRDVRQPLLVPVMAAR